MAKLIYCAISSLDGYIEDAEGKFGWAEPDEEVHAFVNDLVQPVGTYLLGRRMYETLVYWERPPDLATPATGCAGLRRDLAVGREDRLLEDAADDIERQDADRARVREFDPEAVLQLKATAGRDLTVGGPELAAQAIGAGLVDEYHLFLVPGPATSSSRWVSTFRRSSSTNNRSAPASTS
jgi:dihydrofolate reductase